MRRVSHEAFAHLMSGHGDEATRVRKAIDIMSGKSVRGVGPATASAVLAAFRWVSETIGCMCAAVV